MAEIISCKARYMIVDSLEGPAVQANCNVCELGKLVDYYFQYKISRSNPGITLLDAARIYMDSDCREKDPLSEVERREMARRKYETFDEYDDLSEMRWTNW